MVKRLWFPIAWLLANHRSILQLTNKPRDDILAETLNGKAG